MSKFSNVFFASDFDHTLTDQQGSIPRRNIEAIRYFMQEGGIFCVASGRSIPMFRSRFASVPTNAPCILYNGAACYDYPTQRLHYAHPLPDFAREIIGKIRKEYPKLSLEMQGQSHHYVIGLNPWRESFLKSQKVPYIAVEQEIPKPWMKLVICSGEGRSDPQNPKSVSAEIAGQFRELELELKAFCGDKCYVTRSMPVVIEISNPLCSKGTAARTLAEHMGRSILVCAGDAPNDETMLKEADIAFSPKDRDAGLQGAFFREAVPCGEGAIAYAIEELERLL